MKSALWIVALVLLSAGSRQRLIFGPRDLNPVFYAFQRDYYCTPYSGPAEAAPGKERYIGEQAGAPLLAPPLTPHPTMAQKTGLVEMWSAVPHSCDLQRHRREFYDSVWRDALRLETLVNFRTSVTRAGFLSVDPGDFDIDDGLVTTEMFDLLTTDTTQTFGAQNDDILWWALAFLRAYSANPAHSEYLRAAQAVFTRIEHTPEQTACGGGVTWGDGTHYKNAITNTLYLALAARLAGLSTPGSGERSRYLAAAVGEADWLLDRSRLWIDGGVLGDGIHFTGETCSSEPSRDVWTYSQGVALSGLAQLTLLTGDRRYADRAQALLLRVVDPLQSPRLVSAGGILNEPATTPGAANEDAQVFKGIFACHLAYAIRFLEQADSSRYRMAIESGRSLLAANANAVWKARRVRDGRVEFAFNWARTADPGPVNMRTTGSALELLTAAWAVQR